MRAAALPGRVTDPVLGLQTASSTASRLAGHGSRFQTANSLKHCLPPARSRIRFPDRGQPQALPPRLPGHRSRSQTADSLKRCPPPARSRIWVPDCGQPQALPPAQQDHGSRSQTADSLPCCPLPGRVTDLGPGTANSLKHCPPPGRVTDPVPDRGQPCPLSPAFSMQISHHLVASEWGSPLGCLASLDAGLRAVFRLVGD
ncbi:hypothetical protein MDA_GLEAN10004885 [Myotis davidii]|uniref:Uncharacterized protein n=1 Tax=Myotis davidii TaxID=225400 RepID=L5LD78_MYODS|nr:hypothetical protein MDA_GLEAN10004885 [Myotis davidii]